MEKTGKQSELLKKKISEYKEKLTAAIKDCNQVYITTHLNEDYDAIASIGAMALICKRLKKAPYIVVDQKDYDSLFRLVNIPNINKLIQEVNQEKELKQKIFLLGSFINKIKSTLK